MNEHLKKKIREIADFPTPGVGFKDITPLLEDRDSFKEAVQGIAGFFKNEKIDKVVGIDARGFLLAAPAAYILNAAMVIMRKKGKLPHQTIVREHDLEYGRGVLEMHIDSIKKGERLAIIDDVLATGGTAEAAISLVEDSGGKVAGLGFLLEISSFSGRKRLARHKVNSLIVY